MKSIVMWFVKKYALSAVKDAVAAKSNDVAKWATNIGEWIVKVEKVLEFLKKLASRLSDGCLSDNEADAVVAEAQALIADVTK